MKINERTILHIAQSSENPVDHSGWLLKLNEDKKAFQRRWCVLKENILFYYENKNDKEPLGAIILEGYRVEIAENSEQFAFKIDFGVSQFGLRLKSYTFAAESHLEMEKWVKSLSCASYDYLKMVVSELQHRLDELNALKLREPLSFDSLGQNGGKGVSNTKNAAVRSNPFDTPEQEPLQTTFFDLHSLYGRMLRDQFHNNEQETIESIFNNHYND